MRVRLPVPYTALLAGVLFASLAVHDTARAWTLNTLHSFCTQGNCPDGDRPLGALLMDSHGSLYGTTEVGGAHNSGVVFQLKRKGGGGWAYNILHSFCDKTDCADGRSSDARLIMDSSGNLYGVTEFGGAFDCGTVFRLSPTLRGGKWRLKVLHDFCATEADGFWPRSGLAYPGQASGALYDGASPLYGTTSRAGAHGAGIAYALVPDARGKWRETVLHGFCAKAGCTDGAEPLGDLLVNSAGAIFGNTSQGGGTNKGVVFRLTFDAGKWKEMVLYSFCQNDNCPDGGTPLGPLLQDESGALLGGGLDPGDEGVVFKLAPSGKGWQESVLHTFCGNCSDGYDPMGGVIMDASGNLFGAAAFGGGVNGIGSGTIFELSGGQYKVLYIFCSLENCADGVFPQAPLIMDGLGHLYGTTAGGLAEQRGSVFELVP
jgi:uncharacterized repeat protein (TIGR03803 family)